MSDLAADAVDLTPSTAALRMLASLIPELEAPDMSPGSWGGGGKLPDGSMTMPYFEPSELARRIHQACYDHGLVTPAFDWVEWSGTAGGQSLLRSEADLSELSPENITRVITAVLRGDRFCDGTYESFLRSGQMLTVARRAEVLTR